MWDGFDIKGRSILLHAEQGFGDTIQFVRYAPLVAKRAGKVILECPGELTPLLRSVEGLSQIIVKGESLPDFDVHCPLLRLPLIFDTTLESVPAQIPYLGVDHLLIDKWRNKIQDDNSKLKIGLTWAGRPEQKNDRNRSFCFATFLPLAQLEGITFYSLQKGEAAKQARDAPESMKLVDYTEEINDFSDTAAFMENLDLVICVDTAVAHLAGALGKPVWTLLTFVPAWQWLLNREDSPWYPTMKLFRQRSPGDWGTVMVNVERQLVKLLK